MPTIAEVFKQVYGDRLGYSQSYINNLYNTGANTINREAASAIKSSAANLSSRGFYSNRPVAGAIGQINAQKVQSLADLSTSISNKSQEYAQSQQSSLFNASSEEALAGQQQEYTLKNMSVQQQYELAQMAQQFQYDKDLTKLRAKLESKGWGSLLGTIVGGVIGTAVPGIGTALGGVVGNLIGGNSGEGEG